MKRLRGGRFTSETATWTQNLFKIPTGGSRALYIIFFQGEDDERGYRRACKIPGGLKPEAHSKSLTRGGQQRDQNRWYWREQGPACCIANRCEIKSVPSIQVGTAGTAGSEEAN